MAEEKKKPVLRVERSWKIDINDDVYVEPSTTDYDTLVFLSAVEDDEVLFSIPFETLEELYETVKSERARMKTLQEAEKKS